VLVCVELRGGLPAVPGVGQIVVVAGGGRDLVDVPVDTDGPAGRLQWLRARVGTTKEAYQWPRRSR
jgi:hypothetical protein